MILLEKNVTINLIIHVLKGNLTFDCHRELVDKAAKELTSTHITH